MQHLGNEMTTGVLEAFCGVDRSEYLLQLVAVAVELELEVLALADQSVCRTGEAEAVDLETVTQAGLHDVVAAIDLIDQTMDVRPQVVVCRVHMGGNDRSEQQPAESRSGVGRQHQMAERDAPRRREWATVPHLEFRQQHRDNVPSSALRHICDGAQTATKRPRTVWSRNGTRTRRYP